MYLGSRGEGWKEGRNNVDDEIDVDDAADLGRITIRMKGGSLRRREAMCIILTMAN